MNNPAAFPKFILENVPASLRQLANRIEDGHFSARRVVICIETEEGDPDYMAFGEDFSRFYAVGIIQAASHKILKGAMDD